MTFGMKMVPLQNKRRLTILILCMLLVLGVSACQREVEEEPLKITFMHGWGGSLKTHKTMQGIYEEFQKENPEIELNSIPSSDSSITVKNANDMLAVDKMPDIVSTNGLAYYVENVIKQEMALDLMPYIENDTELKEEIHPLVLKSWTNEDGTLYTIPDALEAAGYWYNEAYLIEAGQVDATGEVVLPQNWEEFKVLLGNMQNWSMGKTNISVFTLEDVQLAENLFLARLAGEDEKGLAMAEEVPLHFDTTQMRKTVEDMALFLSYSEDTDSIENARQNFIDGKSVFYFNGVWESEMILGSSYEENIKYAPYPTNYEKTLAYLSPSSGYVIKKHKNEDENMACVGFLKYILSTNMQENMARKTGQAPENPNVDYEKLEKEYPLFGESVQKVMDAQVQIKTIGSVWGTQRTEAVKKTIRAAGEDEAHYQLLIQQLEY